MSSRVALDFVEQPVWSFNRFSPWQLFLFVIGLVLGLSVWHYYAQLNQEYEAVAQTAAPTQAQVYEPEADIRPLTEKELKNLRQTVADLSTPWGQLLSGLEAIKMQQVALLLLEPNKKKSVLTLTGQAKNIEYMLRYVEAVAALPMLSDVYLQNHMIEMNAPEKPVNFTILASWQ